MQRRFGQAASQVIGSTPFGSKKHQRTSYRPWGAAPTESQGPSRETAPAGDNYSRCETRQTFAKEEESAFDRTVNRRDRYAAPTVPLDSKWTQARGPDGPHHISGNPADQRHSPNAPQVQPWRRSGVSLAAPAVAAEATTASPRVASGPSRPRPASVRPKSRRA